VICLFKMRPLHVVLTLGALASSGVLLAMSAVTEDWQRATSIYDFSATDIDGNVVSLDKYRGDVVIITNVATK